MNQSDLKQLEDRYFMVKKSSFWAFSGGALAFLTVAGLISYQGAMQAVKSTGAQQAVQRINNYEAEASNHLQSVVRVCRQTETNAANLTQFVDNRIEFTSLRKARLQRIAELKAERGKVEQQIRDSEAQIQRATGKVGS